MTLTVKQFCFVREKHPLFQPISFNLQPHEVLLVTGDNGVGKSSLLRALAGLSSAYEGELIWQGALPYANQLHYVAHTSGTKLYLTVAEQLYLTQVLYQQEDGFISIDAVIEMLQLLPHKHTQIKQLSAGQRRRVALAKLLLIPKSIWILDEPLTALDQSTQRLLHTLLETHLAQGGLAVISSHQAIEIKHACVKEIKLIAC